MNDVGNSETIAAAHCSASKLDYWRRKLSGELPILDVPKDRPRPAEPIFVAPTRFAFSLSPDLLRRAKAFADAEGTTLFVVLLTAYKALLLRVARQNDLIVGVPAVDPSVDAASESRFGDLALRSELDEKSSFRMAVRRICPLLQEAEREALPFEQVLAALNVPRDLPYHPIFQTRFSLAGMSSPNGTGESEWPACDLALTVSKQGTSGFIDYAPHLYDEDTVARYVGIYARLLAALIAEPERPVRHHALVSPEERRRILYDLNAYQRPEHHYRTMAEPFEEQAARTPDAIALVGDEGTLTYAALNEQANRLAHFLRAAGAGRGRFVAVCMERSFALIVALYAISKSGAAYVPLDPELPGARIAFMLEDTVPALVLVDSAVKDKIPQGPWQIVSMDTDRERWARRPSHDVPCEGSPRDLVYLLYTSGSTGRPKAVAYPVDGALADIFWLQKSYPFQPGDANIFKTSYGFDVSIWEIFWTLYFGATLVVPRPGGHRDPAYLVQLVERYRVTTIFLAPSMLQVFLDTLPERACRSLCWVICGGEPITPRLRDTFYTRLGARLINGYGPTEAGTVTDMILPPDIGSPVVPLGRPAANFRLYVLDENLDVAPIGVPGEAHIAGEVGLAHGYHGRPDLTAERFLPDPFGAPGGRMYRTGDICRYRNDGVLEHLGRAGRQLKLRGMRVELAEIEAVVCEHEQVKDCVVLAVNDESGQRLIAFAVPDGDATLAPRALAEHAGRFLPAYMVPASFVSVARIPININGKVDRDALLAPWREADAGETVLAGASRLELAIAARWANIAGQAPASVSEDFLSSGGDSLRLLRLVGQLSDATGLDLAVSEVTQANTLRSLATALLQKACERTPARADSDCEEELVRRLTAARPRSTPEQAAP